MPQLHSQPTAKPKLRLAKPSPERHLRAATQRAPITLPSAESYPAVAADQDDPEVAAFLVALERIFSGIEPPAPSAPTHFETQQLPLPPLQDREEAPRDN